MIRFRYDNESDAQQGNKTNAQDKVKNRLTDGLILAIIAFSFSISAVRSGYQDKVDQTVIYQSRVQRIIKEEFSKT